MAESRREVQDELAEFLLSPDAPKKNGKSTIPGNAKQVTAMAKVVMATLAGLTRGRAADLAGVSRVQIYRWMNEEETEGPVYERFRNAMARADAHYMRRELAVIQAAARIPNMKTGQIDWRAAAWLMEHRFQFEYGAKAQLEISGPGGGPIQTEVKDLTDEAVSIRLREAVEILKDVGKLEPVAVNGQKPIAE